MEEVYRGIKAASYSLTNSIFPSHILYPPLPQCPPFLCFYGGIIISLSHPLLFRLEQHNKFQDHADVAVFQRSLVLVDSTEKLCRNNTEQQRSEQIPVFIMFFLKSLSSFFYVNIIH